MTRRGFLATAAGVAASTRSVQAAPDVRAFAGSTWNDGRIAYQFAQVMHDVQVGGMATDGQNILGFATRTMRQGEWGWFSNVPEKHAQLPSSR